MLVENREQVGNERDAIKAELEFFGFDGDKLPTRNYRYLGVYTLEPLSPITTHFPYALLGMSQIYGYLDASSLSSSEQTKLLQTYLGGSLKRGVLVSNEEAQRIQKEIEEGRYSMQYQGFVNTETEDVSDRARKFQEAFDMDDDRLTIFRKGKNPNDYYGKYSLIHSDSGIIQNKRIVKSWTGHVERALGSYYGEVDYPKALLAEMILDAPFLDTVTPGRKVDSDAETRHKAYVDQSLAFLKTFNPAERIRVFDELTADFSLDWIKEDPVPTPARGDIAYLAEIYQFAGDILADSKWEISDLYNIYRHSILTRSQIFKASAQRDENGKVQTLFLPSEVPPTSFEEIGGYEYHKGFYQNLLYKLGKNDPRVGDVALVIAAGEPGLGKSLAVRAFLSNLPDNAKGVIFETTHAITERGKLPQYEMVTRLAALHPELQLFVVLEDMDKLAGDRSQNAFSGQFLEIDSVIPDALPGNMHIIGTTNKLDRVDRAITRPGRASKILIYEPPKQEGERIAIVKIHEDALSYPLTDELRAYIGRKATNFTPDEMRHIVWSLAFDEITDPTEKDIDRYIAEIRQKHKMVKDQIGFQLPGNS